MSISSPSSKKTLRTASATSAQLMSEPLQHPARLSCTEGIDGPSANELLLKTLDSLTFNSDFAAHFNLDDFVGREIGCRIESDGVDTVACSTKEAAADAGRSSVTRS